MTRVCISGLGKTGIEVAKVLMEKDNIQLVCVICKPGSDKCGKDVGEIIGCSKTGVIIESADNLQKVIFKTRPDVVLDFSCTGATLRNAKVFSMMKVNMVIGTTGFSQLALKKLFILSQRHNVGIVYTPNITLGVNVLMLLTNLASNILNTYDFQITEIHHKHKKDAPSGTALKISEEIRKGLKASGNSYENVDVPINAIRAGGVIGKHEVMIIGENDKIEISHESFSRKAFAIGAIHALDFIVGKTGYYEMSDVLNLKKVLNDYVEKEGNQFNKKYMLYIPKVYQEDNTSLN